MKEFADNRKKADESLLLSVRDYIAECEERESVRYCAELVEIPEKAEKTAKPRSRATGRAKGKAAFLGAAAECAPIEAAVPLLRKEISADIDMPLDESFSEMLFRKIDEKGLTDAECYKKAGIDRKHFSKIRSNRDYRPGKPTAVAFGIALGLGIDELRELLMKAGYSLTHSSRFDIIIEYCVLHGIYDIFTINDILFNYDQVLLPV